MGSFKRQGHPPRFSFLFSPFNSPDRMLLGLWLLPWESHRQQGRNPVFRARKKLLARKDRKQGPAATSCSSLHGRARQTRASGIALLPSSLIRRSSLMTPSPFQVRSCGTISVRFWRNWNFGRNFVSSGRRIHVPCFCGRAGFFAPCNHPKSPSHLQLLLESLPPDPGLVDGPTEVSYNRNRLPVPGTLHNTNTLESFQALDRQSLMRATAQQVILRSSEHAIPMPFAIDVLWVCNLRADYLVADVF